jgi:hypothetical protein
MMMMMVVVVVVVVVGSEYVSELQPPEGLLFFPQVVYEHGEPWWNDISRVKLLIFPPELSGNLTSSKAGGTIKGID